VSTPQVSLSHLSHERQELVRLMRRVRYGRIEGIVVRDGEPLLAASPIQVTREFKFPSPDPNRGEPERDFLLKAQVLELFQRFEQLGRGTVAALEVRDGLPFRMFVTEASA
jgi:hypothetical protein